MACWLTTDIAPVIDSKLELHCTNGHPCHYVEVDTVDAYNKLISHGKGQNK